MFTATAIDSFAHLLSQGQEHRRVSLGRVFTALLANLSEGSSHEGEPGAGASSCGPWSGVQCPACQSPGGYSSHEGDRLSSYSINGRSDDEFIRAPFLTLLRVLFLVSLLHSFSSPSCLLLLRSRGNECISKAQGVELMLGWITATFHVNACRFVGPGRQPR